MIRGIVKLMDLKVNLADFYIPHKNLGQFAKAYFRHRKAIQ